MLRGRCRASLRPLPASWLLPIIEAPGSKGDAGASYDPKRVRNVWPYGVGVPS
jgi:hypothetical protein